MSQYTKRSDEELHEELTPSQYEVTQHEGTGPACCVTSYWMGVSFLWSSSSEGFVYCDIDPPLNGLRSAGSGADCDCAQLMSKTSNVPVMMSFRWFTAALQAF